MSTIAEYQILIANTPAELETQVMQAIKKGWQPLGGVSITYSDFHSTDHRGDCNDNSVLMLAQAVVKGESPGI